MLIRRFHPDDLEAILAVFYAAVHRVGAKYYDPDQIVAWAPAARTDQAEWLSTFSKHITYVAEVDGKIIGFCDMTKTGEIDRLYVLPEYQGSGASRALFKQLEEDARKLSLTELTTEASIMAKPLAERQGFRVVKIQRKRRRGAEFTTYAMSKTLP